MGDTVVKTLKLSLMTSAMLAGCASFSLFAGSGKSGKLNLGAATTNAVTTTSAEGTWSSTDPGYVTPVVTGDYFEIDTDTDTVSQFNFSTTSDKKYHECEFDVTVSSVPVTNGTLDRTAPSDVQVGFCVFTNKTTGGAAHYAAYAKGEWHDLGEVDNKAEGDYFKLKVILDCNEATKYAQFLVDGRVLEKDGNSWFALSGTPTVANYVFVGSGYVKVFNRAAFVIESENIIIKPDGKDIVITVPESIVTALTNKGKDVSGFVNDTTPGEVTGLNNLERLVLTGKTDEPTAEQRPKTVSKAFGATKAGNISLELDNLADTLPTIGGASPKFVLEGSDDKTAWSTVAENAAGKFEFSATAAEKKFKFYRVKASVVYGNAEK